MKKADRRYALLIDGDGEVTSKSENKKRGSSSRVQYHRMLRMNNTSNKGYRDRSEDSRRLSYENTISHIKLEKYKRWHLPDNRNDIIKEHFGDLVPDWLISDDLRCCSDYYTDTKKDFTWRPLKFKGGQEVFKVYYTMVNRIDYAQELIDRCVGNPDVVLALRELQDKCQLLSLHMELKNCYTEDQLTFVHNDEDDEGVAAIDLYSPLREPVFSVSEIPDMRPFVMSVSFWRDSDGIPTDNLLIHRFLFLLYKALPYPYKRRSIENAIVESWSDIMQRIFLKNSDKNDVEKERMRYERQFTTDIFQITIRIILASLIGVYEHCRFRLDFATRRKVLKWFCMCRESQENFSLWVLKYKEVVLCSYREFLFYMVSQVGGVSDYLEATSHWELLKNITYDAMDSMRLNLNNSISKYMDIYDISSHGTDVFWKSTDSSLSKINSKYGEFNYSFADKIFFNWHPGLPWLYQVQKNLDLANKNVLKSTNRPKTESFRKMVLMKMTEVESKMRKGIVNKDSVDPEYLSPTIKQHVRKYIESGNEFERIPYQVLTGDPVNLDPRSVYNLQLAEFIYDTEEGSVALKHVLADLCKEFPYEYQVIKYFFQEMIRMKGLAFYPTTHDILEKQIKGLRRIYETEDGEELCESAGLYYICTNCNGIKISVRDVSSLNNPVSIGGWTSDGVCICLDDGRFTCSYMNSKDAPKKRDPTKNIIKHIVNAREKGIDIDSLNVKRLMNVDDIRNIRSHCSDRDRDTLDKYIHRRNEFDVCADTELLPVHLQGYIIKLENKMVMLCPECLHPVYYSRRMFRNGVDKMSCGCNTPLSEMPLNCFVCDQECSDYSIIKQIYDDSDPIESDISPVKIVVLCNEHKSTWTRDLDYVPRINQLDSTVKPVKIKITENGSLVEIQKRAKRKSVKQLQPNQNRKTARQMHQDHLRKHTKKDETDVKEEEAIKSSMYKTSVTNNIRNMVSKNKPIGMTYNIAEGKKQ